MTTTTLKFLECERVGNRYRRYPDLPAGFDVARANREDRSVIAFAYRVTSEDHKLPALRATTGVRFVYVPDPSYDFIAVPGDLNRHSPKAKPLTWSEALFVFSRFIEGWFDPVG